MSWRQVEHDDRYRVPFTVYRCRGCNRLLVSTNSYAALPKCDCRR
jgi:hypothetical protein